MHVSHRVFKCWGARLAEHSCQQCRLCVLVLPCASGRRGVQKPMMRFSPSLRLALSHSARGCGCIGSAGAHNYAQQEKGDLGKEQSEHDFARIPVREAIAKANSSKILFALQAGLCLACKLTLRLQWRWELRLW